MAASGRQTELARAAPRLAEEARALLAAVPKPGTQRVGPGEGGGDAGPGPETEPDKDRGTVNAGKITQKDKKEKKHDKQAKKDKKRANKHANHEKQTNRGSGRGCSAGRIASVKMTPLTRALYPPPS